ncbi:MAG TPA: hypothetical protein VFN57_03175 [Thermomicrobiaceae bacterium]|nr:hypothetical protein [Thermomicrobiaceae bacterium]
MTLLSDIAGSPEAKTALQDFVSRYQQGPPQQGYSNQEVMNHYQQVAPKLSNQDYLQAAEAAFSNMSPEQRTQFAQFLSQQAQQRGIQLPAAQGASPGQQQDPGFLAQVTNQLHQQPGGLPQLFGSGALENTVVKAALAGIVAKAAQNIMTRA